MPTATTSEPFPRWAGLPVWLLVGLAIRLALIPFHHPWDLHAWYNLFVDLSRNHSPYETLRELSYSTRAFGGLGPGGAGVVQVGQYSFYEYYAYPPLPILIYYPLAKLAALLVPLRYHFTVQSGVVLTPVPLVVTALFKLPLFAADAATAMLLWRLAGEGGARAFFLNPLVVLVGAAWMIDPLQVVFAVAALALLGRGREGLAGMMLALGALTKWMPALLWPAAGLWLLHQRAPARRQLAFHAAFLATVAVVVLPFREGVALATQFHALRPGGHLTPHMLLFALDEAARGQQTWLLRTLSPVIGAVTAPLALGLAYRVQWKRAMPLPAAASLTVVAFLLGSKLVNETYVVMLLPLLLWEIARRPTEEKRFAFRALYGLAFAFATVNVPIYNFITPAVLLLGPEVPRGAFHLGEAVPRVPHLAVLTVMALAFTAACVYAWRVLAREGRRATIPVPARGPAPDRARVLAADRALRAHDGPALEPGGG